MPSSRSPELVVVGAGPMGRDHVRAALACGLAPEAIEVVALGPERARRLAEETGVGWRAGGVAALAEPPPAAVVAVPVLELAGAARELGELGCPYVLLEKPGALSAAELRQLDGAAVFVAYNRRFYRSVDETRRLVEADGGPLTASFDFTEIEDRVLAEGFPPDVLGRWGLVNSTHVIDLFRHLAGAPVRLEAERAGGLAWHPAGSEYAGSGKTDRGALFSYLASWGGAGRWSVEVTTSERKLILRPLEELHVQRKGTFAVERVELEREPPGVKPGLHGQLLAFLAAAAGAEADPRLCTLDDAADLLDLASRILGYAS